jgi:DNA-binding MarR family transcriptional regulator
MTSKENITKSASLLLETIPLVMRRVHAKLWQEGRLASPGQFRLLWMLSRTQCNLHELAKKQAVRLPTMSRTITKLVEKGWVTRVINRSDRRRVDISLTQKGAKILDEVQELASSYTQDMLSSLTAEEHRILQKGLDMLQRVFKSPGGSGDGMQGEDNAC